MRSDVMGFTPVSKNSKTGPIPVSTSSHCTCPSTCPLRKKGCYGKAGPIEIWWKRLDAGTWGMSWEAFLTEIRKLPRGTFWRHAQAGDLPGRGTAIDRKRLRELTAANKGKFGYAYTHKPLNRDNLAAIREAVKHGFTANLSSNGPSMADRLFDSGLPVVTIVPLGTPKVSYTPKGRQIIICPAQVGLQTSCATCRLCARAHRRFIIGFLPHGRQARQVSAIAAVN